MKRRICTLLLLFSLLAGPAALAEESRAATVYFTAANDTLLELSDATMPFWDKGLLYVPASAFGSGGLGISDSYNAAKKTLTLKRSGYRLICNLASGMTVDISETIITWPAYIIAMTHMPISAAREPPCLIARFQPINSPTRTMPTPRAHTCMGPSTRWEGAALV